MAQTQDEPLSSRDLFLAGDLFVDFSTSSRHPAEESSDKTTIISDTYSNAIQWRTILRTKSFGDLVRVVRISWCQFWRSPVSNTDVLEVRPTGRSRLTNGSHVMPGVDGRSVWARRFRDLMQLHIADLGGDDAVSEAERSIVRRTSAIEVELERMELQFATANAATPADLDLYQRASNTMRRHLEALGLKRVARDVTPSLNDYIQKRGA